MPSSSKSPSTSRSARPFIAAPPRPACSSPAKSSRLNALGNSLGNNLAGVTGGLLVLTVTLAALFAPLVAPYDPIALNPSARLQGPTLEHFVGTDQYGRGTFSRILYGGRVSLFVAFASVAFAAVVGGLLGLLSGFYRGWLDALFMRVTDVFLSFPAILLAIALLAFFGTPRHARATSPSSNL